MIKLHVNIQKLQKFQKENGSIDAYYRQFIDIEKDPTFQLLITNLSKYGSKDKLAELGISLTAEYLRNVGYEMSKPDRHICRILDAEHLGCLNLKVADATDTEIEKAKFEAMKIVDQITSKLIAKYKRQMSVAEVDYILWSYCADGYGETCTENKPKCKTCIATEFCIESSNGKKE